MSILLKKVPTGKVYVGLQLMKVVNSTRFNDDCYSEVFRRGDVYLIPSDIVRKVELDGEALFLMDKNALEKFQNNQLTKWAN